jgi:hypothetical protein
LAYVKTIPAQQDFKTTRLKDAPIGWIYLERRILIPSADDYRRIEQMKFGQGSSAVVSKVRIRISVLPLPASDALV